MSQRNVWTVSDHHLLGSCRSGCSTDGVRVRRATPREAEEVIGWRECRVCGHLNHKQKMIKVQRFFSVRYYLGYPYTACA